MVCDKESVHYQLTTTVLKKSMTLSDLLEVFKQCPSLYTSASSITVKDDYSRLFPGFTHNGDFTDFINLHLLPNVPCMFSKDLTNNWKSRQLWQTDNSPNHDYLAEKFG